MNPEELLQDRTLSNWLRAKRVADNTRRSYLTAMQFYTEFHKMTPTELIEEAEYEQVGKDSVSMRVRRINERI